MSNKWSFLIEWFYEKGCSLGFLGHKMPLPLTPEIDSHAHGNRIDNSTQTYESMDDGSPLPNADCSSQNLNIVHTLCDLIFKERCNVEDLQFKLELMDMKIYLIIIFLSSKGCISSKFEIVNHDTIILWHAFHINTCRSIPSYMDDI